MARPSQSREFDSGPSLLHRIVIEVAPRRHAPATSLGSLVKGSVDDKKSIPAILDRPGVPRMMMEVRSFETGQPGGRARA